MRARSAPEHMHDSTIDEHEHPTQAVSHHLVASIFMCRVGIQKKQKKKDKVKLYRY
jgi:hypothetical protein